jgi:hypothetical protein
MDPTRQPLPAPPQRPLVLVTGSPRSGTTWVGDMLHQCPRTMMFMEPFSPDLSQRASRVCNLLFREWFIYVNDENAAVYREPIRRMLDLKHETFSLLRSAPGMKEAIDVAARGARFRLSRFTTNSSIIKDPLALMSSEWLAREFGARVVVLIRHPAAVVSSFARLKLCVDLRGLLRQPLLLRDLLHPMESELRDFIATEHDRIDEAAMLWKALYFAVLRFQERHPDWLFIRHEDLSKDAVNGFQKICDHVRLPFTPRVRQAVLDSDDAQLPPELDMQQAFTTKRNAALNLTNWKNRLTADEVARIRRRVEEVSRHYYSDAEW